MDLMSSEAQHEGEKKPTASRLNTSPGNDAHHSPAVAVVCNLPVVAGSLPDGLAGW